MGGPERWRAAGEEKVGVGEKGEKKALNWVNGYFLLIG